ncbi:Cell wall / vacuolar inhibitor of fructosidase [Actinidia chinensis var. chinensis]|uniref:Cell wall / vacuolar inhibitor of fructosidase n=1 Tax=Actinidia chinensis var. chinensis TaxID=1590841 RepID=A0A2R6S0U9_ACTCC|nr:Cell wall / vacuolar inhibitor of fructosidase [Actinidia chinensis var. chinensis]
MSMSFTMTRVVLLFLFVSSALNYRSQADLIDKTCMETQYSGLCISTLRSSRSSKGADRDGLVRIIFQTGLAKATSTLNLVNNLLKRATDGSPLQECLETCADVYETIQIYVQDSLEDVGVNNNEAADYGEKAENELQDCEQAFSEKNIKTPLPLVANNNVVKQLVIIGTDLVVV